MKKRILVSQPNPTSEKSPYFDIQKKYDVELTFKPFVRVETLTAKEFKDMKVTLLGYTAVVFTSGTLESVYADGVSAGVCLKELKEWLGRLARGGGPAEDAPDGEGEAADRPGGDGHRRVTGRATPGGRCVLRASQAIRVTMRFLSRGAYIGCSAGFVEMLAGKLPPSFPREGDLSLRQCMSLSWELPTERGAA